MVRSPPRIGLFRSFMVMSSFVLWYVDLSTHHSSATNTTGQCFQQTNPTLLGKNDERGGHRNTKTPATNHDLPNLRARNHRLPHTLIGGVLLNHHGDLDTIDNILGRRCLPDEHVADRKSTRLNSSHVSMSYAVFCLKKQRMSIHRAAVGR